MKSLLHTITLALTLLVLPLTASDLVTYQGKLTDAASTPLPNGQYWIGVRVWDVASGGTTPLWARKYQVPVVSGLFTAMLGAAGTPWESPPPLTSSLNLAVSSGNRFLEITVMSNASGPEKVEGEWQVLAPRQALGTVPTAMNGVPPGTVVPFAGTVIPDGWALCDGSTLDGSDPRFSRLFSVIATTYGAGVANEFNVPDMRGRTAIGSGKGDTWMLGGVDQSTNWVLAQKSGAEKHKLIEGEMPRHNHDFSDPGHSHKQTVSPYLSGNFLIATTGGRFETNISDQSPRTQHVGTGITFNPKGNDQPHNNMQPSLVLNYIIKL